MSRHLSVYDIPSNKWISRSELVDLTGQSDRKNREDIANLRKDGYVILSFSNGKGYKLATDNDEELVRNCRAEIYGRAMESMALLKTYDKWLAKPPKSQLEFCFNEL